MYRSVPITCEILSQKIDPYTLFGSKESEWMESIEDGKFIGKRVSTVWLLH
jgi:hypothetical protein